MWSDNETTQDLLGFQVHADLIRSIVTDPNLLPVTIGVFGDWGSGKTSVMKMLERDLDPENYPEGSEEKAKYERIACLYFNGWLFEGYDDAKAAILSSVLLQLGEHKRFGPKVRDSVVTLLKSVNWMRLARLGFEKVALPAITAYVTGGASLIPGLMGSAKTLLGIGQQEGIKDGEDISKDAGEDAHVTVNWEELIKADKTPSGPLDVRFFREQFAKMIQECDIDSLVVLIDDLDRCSPERIIDNLEAIKLFLNVEYTAFVIGADPRIVRHAIATRYKPSEIQEQDEQREAEERLVTDYLEKLIQVPYHLPRLSPAEVETYMVLLFCLRDLDEEGFKKCFEAYKQRYAQNRYSVFGYADVRDALEDKELSEESKGLSEHLSQSLAFCASSALLITEGLKGNPRQVKRFLNAFILRKKLAQVANLSHVRDDVLVKLMVLEYGHLRQFRKLYEWQASQEGSPTQIKELEKIIRPPDGSINNEKEAKEADQEWGTQIFTRKWIAMDPPLSDVDLRDYFWISRDRLQSTLSDVSMIPPIVRRILEDLLSGNAGKLNGAAQNACDLHEDERNSLLILLEKHVQQHPSQKSGHEALHALIERSIPGAAESLAKALSECPPKAIRRTEGIDLINLMEGKPELRAIFQPVINQLAKTDSGIGLAIKQRRESKSKI